MPIAWVVMNPPFFIGFIHYNFIHCVESLNLELWCELRHLLAFKVNTIYKFSEPHTSPTRYHQFRIHSVFQLKRKIEVEKTFKNTLEHPIFMFGIHFILWSIVADFVWFGSVWFGYKRYLIAKCSDSTWYRVKVFALCKVWMTTLFSSFFPGFFFMLV